MADMSKYPSCGVKLEILKIASNGNDCLESRHLAGCQIGRAVLQKGPTYCSRCSARFTLSNQMIFSYFGGGGTASLDCPICWAVAGAQK